MEVVNFAESNSVINRYIAELRDIHIQNDRIRFRRNMERIGEMIGYEISKRFRYQTQNVETPLGIAPVCIPNDIPVLATILRAGIPFHQGFLNCFDNAENAFVSAYRKYIDDKNFDVFIEYIASPSIENKTLIIADPMLATGSSMELAYKALLTKGTPSHTHLAVIVASEQAIDYLTDKFPSEKTTLWVGAIDPGLNAHKYIVPGLGDAGDLAYGAK